jgi:hypothetical protein
MYKNQSKIYKYHVNNLKEIELGINHIKRLIRAEIASKDPQNSVKSLLRLYAFLIGAWAETRLKKLINEKNGFNDLERNNIESKSTQLEQWKFTVDLAFRKHYSITKAELNQKTLGVTSNARLEALHSTLSNELKIIIEIRNKLAHGQWIYPFTSDGKKIDEEKFKLINLEDFQSLDYKYDLIRHLANTIHDLIVSIKTFERDFDSNFNRLEQTRTRLNTQNYEDYKALLIAKREQARKNKSN